MGEGANIPPHRQRKNLGTSTEDQLVGSKPAKYVKNGRKRSASTPRGGEWTRETVTHHGKMLLLLLETVFLILDDQQLVKGALIDLTHSLL